MKRLVICFDGTWNELDAPHSTNVLITAQSVNPSARDGVAQPIFYCEGVGTGDNDYYRGGIFGTGLVQNMAEAYLFLIFNYSAGDQIYIFGFSRGAFTARSFAGMLSNCGILRREHAARAKEAISLYQDRNVKSAAYQEKMLRFRGDYCSDVCVSAAEDEWRASKIPGYLKGDSVLLSITYLGVWDTVGSLGVPERYRLLQHFNKKHEFHDTNLSEFVLSARHAVAIDEHRRDFPPTLWLNVDELNKLRGKDSSDPEAPYQQQWFPGTHGSVGGGGDRRGLSDQAFDWVLDGARQRGLDFDIKPGSRIFELAPDYREHLSNSSEDPGFADLILSIGSKDRLPGPQSLTAVSRSAKRRWHENAEGLPEKATYRPATLDDVADQLNAVRRETLGIGFQPPKNFELHIVKQRETLRHLAKQFFGTVEHWSRIFEANLDTIDDPNRIYAGRVLRIPRDEPDSEANKTPSETPEQK